MFQRRDFSSQKIIPDKVRIPAYITIVAGFVTIVQLLIKAYVPALNKSLGVFLPLIVVNCIILGRAEMFASKNPVLPSIVDGLGMGVGFTAALLAMGIIRELLGAGTVFGIPILSNFMDPIIISCSRRAASSCSVFSSPLRASFPRRAKRRRPWAALHARWRLPAPRYRKNVKRRAAKHES